MKGVILDIVPEAQIVDICHSVQPFDVLDGALTISQAYSYFPTRTVHVVVVDPGGGTARRPILGFERRIPFRSARQRCAFAGLTRAENRMHVRHITAEHYFLQPVSNTFHARDIFSPVAAYLAKEVEALKVWRGGSGVRSLFGAPKPKAVDRTGCAGGAESRPLRKTFITNITPQDAPMLFEAGASGFKIVVGSREITEIRSAMRTVSGRSNWNSRQHGFSGNCRHTRSGRPTDRRRQGIRSEHHSG